MSVHRMNDREYLALGEDNLNYFEITGDAREAAEENANRGSFSDWKENPIHVGDYMVIPFGDDNDIPQRLQSTVLNNSLAPRILNRKIELLIEQGPYLYRQTKDGRKYFRDPVEDEAITAWLKENNYYETLVHNAVQWYYQTQIYTKFIRNRAGRIGQGTIRSLEGMNGFQCRLAYRRDDLREIPTHVLVGDWDNDRQEDFEAYPLFERNDPGRHPVSVHLSKFPTYGMGDYALPEVNGSLDWIELSTNVPKIFKAMIKNSVNIKWHIQSPQKYWDDKRDIIRENCKNSTPPKDYKEQMLIDLKKKILGKLSELLSGVENVGKFWHNEYVVELIGANAREHGWKITPIEQKIKEYVESKVMISDKADFATLAGLGLHSALGNVGADGKSDSGSEQLYALKIHQLTSVNLVEHYVCKPYNDAIALRFSSDIRLGFYHINPEREQDITESNRVTQQTP